MNGGRQLLLDLTLVSTGVRATAPQHVEGRFRSFADAQRGHMPIPNNLSASVVLLAQELVMQIFGGAGLGEKTFDMAAFK